MKYIDIIKILQKHLRLQEERSLFAEKKMVSKIFTIIGILFFAVYMAFLSVAIGMGGNAIVGEASSDEVISTVGFFFMMLPLFLLIDYGLRLSMSKTPMQFIRPYTTLPVPRYAVIDCFLLNTVTQVFNFAWLSLTFPFCILSVLFRYNAWGAILFLLAVQIIFILNSLLYILIRAYATRLFIFWFLPVVIYLLPLSPLLLCFKSEDMGLEAFFELNTVVGDALTNGNISAWIILLGVTAGMWYINRKVQYKVSYQDNAEATNTKELKNVSSLSMFDRFGMIGQYIKIDIKSIMRNKTVKKQFYMIIAVTLMFSLINTFSDVYGETASMFGYGFWTNYSYILIVLMQALGIMTQEGNYIECLMVRKESIYDLMKAKYTILLIMLMMPLIILIPTVIMGKITFLYLIAMYFLSAGPVSFGMMHMVYFNNYSLPLNATISNTSGSASGEIKTITGIISLIALFVPTLLVSGLESIMNPDIAYITIIVIGALFVATNSLWLRNIYRLFMKRRYKNMEGFRETRS